MGACCKVGDVMLIDVDEAFGWVSGFRGWEEEASDESGGGGASGAGTVSLMRLWPGPIETGVAGYRCLKELEE